MDTVLFFPALFENDYSLSLSYMHMHLWFISIFLPKSESWRICYVGALLL